MTGIGRVLRRFTGLSMTAVLLLAGCSSNHQPQQPTPTPSNPAGWPATLSDFTVVWTAEPGIDVTTWPPVAVRAYAES